MSLSVDTHCQMLTDHIRDRNLAIMDGFKLFVQLYSALVGGSLVIRLQYGAKMTARYSGLADGVSALIFVVCLIIILENIRSWYDYRKVLSAAAGKFDGRYIIPPPAWLKAMRIEVVMILVMATAMYMFIQFNPLLS